VAESGFRATEENRRHQSALDGQAAVADGIDAPVEAMETTGGAALADCAVSKAETL
jgi:hypothetical protein